MRERISGTGALFPALCRRRFFRISTSGVPGAVPSAPWTGRSIAGEHFILRPWMDL